MTPQELLASLSQLEKELKDVSSARKQVEENNKGVQLIHSDILKSIGNIQDLISRIQGVITHVSESDVTFRTDLNKILDGLSHRLEGIYDLYSRQSQDLIQKLNGNLQEIAKNFSNHSDNIATELKDNNEVFSNNLVALSTVLTDLKKSIEIVSSLKNKIDEIKTKLEETHKVHEDKLHNIGEQLNSSAQKNIDILSRLSKDLKESQNNQDVDLAQIKNGQNAQIQKIDGLLTKSKQRDNDISNNQKEILKEFEGNKEVSKSIVDKISSLEEIIENKVRVNMWLIIVNLLVTIAALVIALVK